MVIRNILPKKHGKGHNKMKKVIIIVTILILIAGIFLCTNKIYAAEKAIDNSTEEIVQTFLPYTTQAKLQILNNDNKIDRKALGKLLFENPQLLKKQEELIYPKVIQMTEDFILQNKKAIINATVLYKIPHLLQRCQTIVYVKAPLLKRIFRAKKRDHLPLKQIIARFNSQKNLFKEYKKSGIKIIIIKN